MLTKIAKNESAETPGCHCGSNSDHWSDSDHLTKMVWFYLMLMPSSERKRIKKIFSSFRDIRIWNLSKETHKFIRSFSRICPIFESLSTFIQFFSEKTIYFIVIVMVVVMVIVVELLVIKLLNLMNKTIIAGTITWSGVPVPAPDSPDRRKSGWPSSWSLNVRDWGMDFLEDGKVGRVLIQFID